ncbi:MAG: G-D-S-L family lipolytic protein [Gammaproteobacteria bacterium]|nr:G-D-S-L family lipolytic protein [Gammaproteobacteria bacterium]
MKNQIIKLAGIVIACAVVSACDADFDNPISGNTGDSGTADLSKFVTIGDSLTAGYADGALYLAGQENSYPSILAQQFAAVGGDANFTQPLVSDNLGGLLAGGIQITDNQLVLDLTDPTSPSPVTVTGTPTTEAIGSGLNGTAFSNMGVPGAKSFHLGAPGYGDPAGILLGLSNPYFARFASVPATATMIGDAAVQVPSFFVMWIGNNDVLSYATTGGIGVDQAGFYDPALYGSNDITDPTVFAGTYAGLVGALTANPATQGVLVNIPDVSTIPYFTTVPYNPVPFDVVDPVDQGTIVALNDGYAAYNGGVAYALSLDIITVEEAALRTILFSDGQNAVVIMDEDLTDITFIDAGLINMRQATAADFLVLTTSSKIGTEMIPGNPATVWGLGVPLEDSDVLIPSEVAAIDTARTAFNATIQAAADANPNLMLVDSSAIMLEISTTGIDYGTGSINADYATGGAFSLDGVHPTARGYAVVANRIIDAINTGFGATIPAVNPGDYTTIFVQ